VKHAEAFGNLMFLQGNWWKVKQRNTCRNIKCTDLLINAIWGVVYISAVGDPSEGADAGDQNADDMLNSS